MTWWQRRYNPALDYGQNTEDGSSNWIKHLIALALKIRCQNHISGFFDQSLSCQLFKWHEERHFDPKTNYRWSYGDEFYDRK